MIGASFLGRQTTRRHRRGTVVRQYLVTFHEKLSNDGRMPRGPRTRRSVELTDHAREQPRVHQHQSVEAFQTLQSRADSLRPAPILADNHELAQVELVE